MNLENNGVEKRQVFFSLKKKENSLADTQFSHKMSRLARELWDLARIWKKLTQPVLSLIRLSRFVLDLNSILVESVQKSVHGTHFGDPVVVPRTAACWHPYSLCHNIVFLVVLLFDFVTVQYQPTLPSYFESAHNETGSAWLK